MPIVALVFLAACGQQQSAEAQPESMALDDTGPPPARGDASPDTSDASWRVAEDGQSIRFGDGDEAPLLSLKCDLSGDPQQFSIVRHADALPGQSALFPFVGNGMRSRFFADAVLSDGEWRWEAKLPADDPQLDIFEGNRRLTATLPGRGMLEISGSRIPGEFLAWCRSGGANAQVEGPADPSEV
ncbi:hypothetical protein D6201_00075 [Aurantiacibacter aquimixticola]|uniref:Uncharacterized protein n=1 Tax=Aurantiacibacter aquimixticola TaxID=1958945 RepID=A0A419RQ90_9SPHN|nr:hypothetical protein D6201_00075 [Aurantiacibacter aquimixticola]